MEKKLKVLMISIDRGLLGNSPLGDVIERHKRYGEFCESLDIIVCAKKGFSENQISEKVKATPTNSSSKIKYVFDAIKIGKRLFGQKTYDLIVTQDPFLTGLAGYFLKKRFKAKLLVHFHGDFWRNPYWLKENKFNRLFLSISQFVVKKSDAIRVMSQGQKDKMVKAGISENKIRVISTPIDINKFQNQELRIKNPSSKEKIILYVGRDDDVKDYDTLTKAVRLVRKELPGVIFWQIGSKKKIMEAADKMNLKVDFHLRLEGWMDSNSIIERYKFSDVVVLSSTSESFGKVLVEANACDKPVGSTTTTGAKEIIQDGYNGFLVPIGDAQALAEKILYLLNNPEKAKEMGENGRKLVKERFSDNTEKIINFWQEICANRI